MWRFQEDNPLDFLDEDEQGHYITDPVRLQTCRSQMKLLETKLKNKNTEIKTIKEMLSESETKSAKFYSENEGLRGKISTLNYEILDLKRREQTMNCSLNEASIKHQKLFNDNISKQNEIEQKSKEIQNLCVQNQELELQLVKIGQTEQTIHLNMTETLKQLNKKDGLGFKEDDLNENPKILAKAMSKCSVLYNFDIIEIGANANDVVFVHASDQEKIFEKTLEDIKRNKVNKCQLNIDYSLLNSMSLSQTDQVFESKIPTYPENLINNSSDMLLYTPSLILEQRFEELQSLLYQMKISNDLDQFFENKTSNFFHSESEQHCSHDHVTKLKFDQKFLFYQNELQIKDNIIKDHEKERKNMERHFEESQSYIFQMEVSHILEIDVLCDKFETYFEKLEHQKHHFENKANTNIKLLKKEKAEYGMLWEKFCTLKEQVSSSSNESFSYESQVSKQIFDQKVIFFKKALLGKDETIDVLQKQIDSLMVSKPCFPKETNNIKSEPISKVNSPTSKKRNKKSSPKLQQNENSPSSVKTSNSKINFTNNRGSITKNCFPLTKQETKSFMYSIPELFEYAPAHFQISLKRNFSSESKIKQSQIPSTNADKSKVFSSKQKWVQKSTIISKSISNSNVIQNSPSQKLKSSIKHHALPKNNKTTSTFVNTISSKSLKQTKQTWIPKSPGDSKTKSQTKVVPLQTPPPFHPQKWISNSSFKSKDKNKSENIQRNSQLFPSKQHKQNSRPWISHFPSSNNSPHMHLVRNQKFVPKFQLNKTTGFSKTSTQSKSKVSRVLFHSPAEKWVPISPNISNIDTQTVCPSEKKNSYFSRLIDNTVNWFANNGGPKLNWVSHVKVVAPAGL